MEPSIAYRPATVDDLDPAAGVFNRAQNDLYRRCGYDRDDRPAEVFAIPQRHVVAHDPGRCFVAERAGEVVAFGSAIVRGEAWYLSALFVDPAVQGQGVGRSLFELAAADWPARRMTIMDAIQPISTGLYASRGLIPTTPVLPFGGTPSVIAPDDLEPRDPTAADVVDLDLAAYGFDRSVDHAFWTATSRGTVWWRGGQPLAYSYVTPGGWVGPLAGRDESAADLALRAELARQPTVMLEIPGSASLLVETAMAAGLRLVDPPGLLLHNRPARLPTAIVLSGYWLM